MAIKEKIKKVRKSRQKPALQNQHIAKQKSVSQFFGINRKEVDGLEFQKRVRNEWQ